MSDREFRFHIDVLKRQMNLMWSQFIYARVYKKSYLYTLIQEHMLQSPLPIPIDSLYGLCIALVKDIMRHELDHLDSILLITKPNNDYGDYTHLIKLKTFCEGNSL